VEVLCLDIYSDDVAKAALYQSIGQLVVRFPLLHCEECAITLVKWLKQRRIPGQLWRISTRYDTEDFILSSRLEEKGCFETITENGIHYGVEVFGKVFDNLSDQGLPYHVWISDFSSLSNEFDVEMIKAF
jgi:hypothetical protein